MSRQESPSMERYRETKTLMGTTVQVDVCYAQDDQPRLAAAYGDVWARLDEIHWRMSVFNDRSDLAKINRSYQNPVEVGADTYQLIRDAMGYAELTQGTFDITVWPLIALWKKAAKDNQMPTEKEVQAVQQSLGVQNIRLLDHHRVEVLNPAIKVDLGGIAKGYAVDEAARLLRENGFADFFIDAGGDIYVGGQSCQGRAWRIGIRDPRNRSEVMDVVELENAAVTTSGDYEQFYDIQGQRWSHIINPVTGYPQKGVVSATVIASSATAADALSTALCVLGPHKGISLIDSLGEEFSALVVVPEGEGLIRKYKSQGDFADKRLLKE